MLLTWRVSVDAGGKEADSAEASALIVKAVKALGGEAKLAKFRGASWKGKLNVDADGVQLNINLDAISDGWDRHRVDAEVQVNGMTQNALLVLNRGKGWIKANNNEMMLPEKEVAKVQDFLFTARLPNVLADLKDKKYGLSHLGEVKVGEREAVGLRISRKGQSDISLFFDKKNQLPIKAGFRFNDGQKEFDMDVLYANYRDHDGCQMFSTLTFKGDGKEFRMELSDVRARDDLDDGTFAKPQ